MRIAIKDETFEKIYIAIKESGDTETADILEKAKEKYQESNTEKKKDGAKKAALINAEKKKKKVRQVYEKYILQNQKINVSQISQEADVSYNTAKKYVLELQGLSDKN